MMRPAVARRVATIPFPSRRTLLPVSGTGLCRGSGRCLLAGFAQLPAPGPHRLPDSGDVTGAGAVAGEFLIGETVHRGEGLGEDVRLETGISLGGERQQLLVAVAPARHDRGEVEVIAGFPAAEQRRGLGGHRAGFGQRRPGWPPGRRMGPRTGRQAGHGHLPGMRVAYRHPAVTASSLLPRLQRRGTRLFYAATVTCRARCPPLASPPGFCLAAVPPVAVGSPLPRPAGASARQAGMAMTRMGAVVGCEVPPAGSMVMPSLSPGDTVEARTGTVWPARAAGSSPAGRAPAGLISHSS